MNREKFHTYKSSIVWTGNKGSGTDSYKNYERSHIISIQNKCDIHASSDAPFRGDITKHNPEDLFLSSISTCHMLWYLHLCADNGIVVHEYSDEAVGIMIQTETSGGHFTQVTLHPKVEIEDASSIDLAKALHNKANELCFIANSLNFKVEHHSVIEVYKK